MKVVMVSRFLYFIMLYIFNADSVRSLSQLHVKLRFFIIGQEIICFACLNKKGCWFAPNYMYVIVQCISKRCITCLNSELGPLQAIIM
jgi:hypothetical protein